MTSQPRMASFDCFWWNITRPTPDCFSTSCATKHVRISRWFGCPPSSMPWCSSGSTRFDAMLWTCSCRTRKGSNPSDVSATARIFRSSRSRKNRAGRGERCRCSSGRRRRHLHQRAHKLTQHDSRGPVCDCASSPYRRTARVVADRRTHGSLQSTGIHDARRSPIKIARRQRLPLTLAFADLDGLKAINDKCGHMWGDSALQGHRQHP